MKVSAQIPHNSILISIVDNDRCHYTGEIYDSLITSLAAPCGCVAKHRPIASAVLPNLRPRPISIQLLEVQIRPHKIKCLFWEDNGFVLYYKSLDEEKFKWPKRTDELVILTGQQLNWLLDGYDISLMKGHKKLDYESLF